jgi:hypothetical protein
MLLKTIKNKEAIRPLHIPWTSEKIDFSGVRTKTLDKIRNEGQRDNLREPPTDNISE